MSEGITGAPENAGSRPTMMQNRVVHGIDTRNVTTGTELPGYRLVQNLGLVRGITVRSRSLFGTIGASFQTLVGGNISLFTELCEKTRTEAFELMLGQAAALGANGVIAMRYDANEVMEGVTEVLAYGTAVVVEPLDGTGIYGS